MKWLAVVLSGLVPACALAAGTLDPASIAGVYKFAHDTRDFTDSPPGIVRSEDVLEIVKISPREAYIRTRLLFDNGHSCATSGIARVEGGALVYHQPITEYHGQQAMPGMCALSLSLSGGRLVFADRDGKCKWDNCGMRGSYDGASFELNSRRPIRYMARLKASREYAQALKEHDARKGAP